MEKFNKRIEDLNYNQYERDVGQRVVAAAQSSFYSGEQELDDIDDEDPFGSLSLSWLCEGMDIFDSDPLPEDSIEDISDTDKQAVEAMRKLIWHNLLEAGRQYKDLEDKKIIDQLLINIDRRKGKNNANIDFRRRLAKDLRGIRQNLDQLSEQTPESHTLVHGYEFRDHIKQIQSGEMVTTPYVKKHLDKVKTCIALGQPVFLHGHLGSGKTELAINAAIEASIENAACEETGLGMQRFRKEHPDASGDERREELRRLFQNNLSFLKKSFREGDKRAHEAFSPLIITGSKDLRAEDLFVDKTLKLSKFNGKALSEHMADLEAEKQEWIQAHPDEAKDPEKRRTAEAEIIE